MTVLVCLWPKQQSKYQVPVNHCIYLPTYLIKKYITAIRRVGAAKYKTWVIKYGSSLWKNGIKQKGHSNINYKIKHKLYTCITRHPQVVQSPIFNDCLRVIFDDQTEPKMIPKLLLQVSVRELHKILVSNTNDGDIKEAREEENHIIISDYTLCKFLPPQLK